MELMEAIEARRSVRAYKPDMVEREKIEKTLHAAVQAPSGMNAQPWAFGVIQDRERLKSYSECIKIDLLNKVEEQPWLARYQEHFANPAYNIFYNAPTLVVIYAKEATPIAQIDCCLAAENLMLAAADLGLGTCWIGFSYDFMNMPSVKQELGVPEEYAAMAPIILGYPDGPIPPREKNPPETVYWR